MTPRARRRRGALLLALAVACGGLAASRVSSRVDAVDAQIGSPVPVVVARSDLSPGTRITSASAPHVLAVRQVPQRFAPSDALESPTQAIGGRLAALVPAGGYLTGGTLAQHDPREDRGDAPLAPGERSLDVAVAGGAALASAGAGARVDVLVTTDPSSGGGRTFLALEDVELLAVRPGGGGGDAAGGAASHATDVATLRVTLRQAVFLTAAESFAREIRLLVRAPGDRSSAPPLSVGGRALR